MKGYLKKIVKVESISNKKVVGSRRFNSNNKIDINKVLDSGKQLAICCRDLLRMVQERILGYQ